MWRVRTPRGIDTLPPKGCPKPRSSISPPELPNYWAQSNLTYWQMANGTSVKIHAFLDDPQVQGKVGRWHRILKEFFAERPAASIGELRRNERGEIALTDSALYESGQTQICEVSRPVSQIGLGTYATLFLRGLPFGFDRAPYSFALSCRAR